MENKKYEKVLFELNPTDWHGHGSETLWGCAVSPGIYKLMNSPFFVRGVSNQDLVRVLERDGVNQFAEVIERGGHSTFMILIEPSTLEWERYWKELEKHFCSYESGYIDISLGRKLMYSVDCMNESDLKTVINTLREGERQGFWHYQAGYKA